MDITVLGETRILSPPPITRQRYLESAFRRHRRSRGSIDKRNPVRGCRTAQAAVLRPDYGIVTCGGLCPGLNNVILSLVLELNHGYGVREILGFRNGYQGLDHWRGAEPIAINPKLVEYIHKDAGTVLNTSRGPEDISVAVDNLIRRKVDILFVISGNGSQRGGSDIYQEARRRGHPLSVVGIPKTIDHDIVFVSRTFSYLTTVEEASKTINCAHTEAHSVLNGISLVKIMGRHAGFIAAGATIANQDVNFTLVPEVPFALEGENGFLAELKKRIINRAHAVILVAEGAGQHLFGDSEQQFDASGNLKCQGHRVTPARTY